MRTTSNHTVVTSAVESKAKLTGSSLIGRLLLECRGVLRFKLIAGFCLLLAGSLFTLLSGDATAEEVFYVTVEAGKFDRKDTLLSVPLPKFLHSFPRLALVRRDQSLVPGQVIEDRQVTEDRQVIEGNSASRQLVWRLSRELRRGESRTYEILVPPPGKPVQKDLISCRRQDWKLQVKIGDKRVLDYNVSTQEPPDGLPKFYRRSGYIHPLFSPGGKVVTGDFSPGHPHQHGLFFAWTKARFEGKAVEFWNQKLQLGKVEHQSVVKLESGPLLGRFQVKHLHSGVHDKEVTPILSETWEVTISSRDGLFVVDLEMLQECATKSPLVVEKYHYGGMAIRGAAQWELEPASQAASKTSKPTMLTSEGLDRVAGNHSRPNWVTMQGSIDKEATGVAVLSHPSNFRAPQYVRLHPKRPYFCFAPMVEREFRITPDEPYRGRYRFLVYSEETDVKKIERLWQDFAEPPKVTLEELAE